MPLPRIPLPDPDDLPHRPARGCLIGFLASLAMLAVFVLGFYAWLSAATPPIPLCTALVQEVHDGDTITVLCDSQRQHVRLAGIDAPELSQPYGDAALNRVVALVLGRTVTLSAGHLDFHGRRVAVVTMADGRSLGLVLVQEGLAWHYVQYARHATDLAAAQAQAKAQRLGLWQDAAPIAPWDWRKGKRP